jgi:hypothetical protein
MILALMASIIKQISQGIPLWKISMPSVIHTDLSGLEAIQLLIFRNRDALNQLELLNNTIDPIQRLGLVIGYLIDPHTVFFVDKPTNPVLGELISCKSIDEKYQFDIKQTSHHPPKSSCQVNGPNFRLYAPQGIIIDGFRSIKPGFNKVDIEFPNCMIRIETRSGYVLEWQNIGYRVDGLVGKRHVSYYGTIEILDKSSGYKFVGSTKATIIRGEIFNERGDRVHIVKGNTKEGVFLDNSDLWFCPIKDDPLDVKYDQDVLKDPMFSRNVWKDMFDAIRRKDYAQADEAKHLVEEAQRKRASTVASQLQSHLWEE